MDTEKINLVHIFVVAPILWFAAEGRIDPQLLKLLAGVVVVGHSYKYGKKTGMI
jgi:hypothetical protein